MKALDFIKTYEKINNDNKNATFFKSSTMYEFAEDYHQAKLKLLGIGGVVSTSKCDCKHTGSCRYEEVVLKTKEICRHKE